MAELFVELLGEEIPARMQKAAEKQLADAVTGGLIELGLLDKAEAAQENAMQSWSGPRRLAVSVTGVAVMQPDLSEEKRGPRVDAPDQAIEGFLKSAGISRDQAETRSLPKGDFLFAVISRKGRAATDVVPGMLSGILAGFNWPKSMRWHRSTRGWIRPLHRVSVLFDGKPLSGSFDLGGDMAISFGDKTVGHRMLAPGEISLTGGADYPALLEAQYVMASRQQRIDDIRHQLESRAESMGLKLRADDGLLDEVAGLVEYPHAVIGTIDDDFMALPVEILVTTMRSHQKYFAFEIASENTGENTGDTHPGQLAPCFATIANMTPDEARDATIRSGNERVLRARLADARFFWEQDRADGLDAMAGKLSQITFFDKLGTMADKAVRIAGLAGFMADALGEDSALATRAGSLAKADLVSQTVGEFPEVQGIIGGYLAEAAEGGDVAAAIASHYRPEGPADAIPETRLGQIVALADKIDTLVAFFGIGSIPTGSKDPFALRRAALGVIRMVIEDSTILRLNAVFAHAARQHGFDAAPDTLMPFLHDRLKVWMRDRGIRHDIVAAVIRGDDAPHSKVGETKAGDTDDRSDDLLHLYRLAETLASFLATDDGKGLMAGYTRAANILAAEEKKDKTRFNAVVDESLLKEDEEAALFAAIAALGGQPVSSTDDAIARMQALGGLRAVIDAFFDVVTVNHDDAAIRLNRLNLLGQVRGAMVEIADFSAIENG